MRTFLPTFSDPNYQISYNLLDKKLCFGLFLVLEKILAFWNVGNFYEKWVVKAS